jgi:hypothetical protein
MLSNNEVRERLASYKDSKITDELYEVGKTLVSENLDRVKTLDNKAAAIAAYSIGLITLLVSTRSGWAGAIRMWATGLPVCAGITAFSAACFCVWSLALKRYDWFSENEWFSSECFSDPERLRRYHVLVMWKVVGSHSTVCDEKANKIAIAQWFLLASAVILVITLADTAIFRFSIGLII